jgi:hypothetical protein
LFQNHLLEFKLLKPLAMKLLCILTAICIMAILFSDCIMAQTTPGKDNKTGSLYSTLSHSNSDKSCSLNLNLYPAYPCNTGFLNDNVLSITTGYDKFHIDNMLKTPGITNDFKVYNTYNEKLENLTRMPVFLKTDYDAYIPKQKAARERALSDRRSYRTAAFVFTRSVEYSHPGAYKTTYEDRLDKYPKLNTPVRQAPKKDKK